MRQYNMAHPVLPNDEDLLRCQKLLAALVHGLHEWAKGSSEETITDWFQLPRNSREITRGFRSVLFRMDPDDITGYLLASMPHQTQKILGKPNLKVEDLLHIAKIPYEFQQRIVYVDVATMLPRSAIVYNPSEIGPCQRVKAIKGDFDYANIIDAKLYVGSSIKAKGAYLRIADHEHQSQKQTSEEGQSNVPKHYRYTRQPNVATNFRLIGAFQNPELLRAESVVFQDMDRWMPVFFEGVIMAFFGFFINRRNNSPFLREKSQILIRRIRESLALPEFDHVSLNAAWSLTQGVYGGMAIARNCANPHCRRPFVPAGQKAEDHEARCFWVVVEGLRYCVGCASYALQHDGAMRSRQGIANGLFSTVTSHINRTWFSSGNPRACSNCHVPIDHHADVYGLAAGARCKRCHEHALEHRTEWAQTLCASNKAQTISQCDVCRSSTSTLSC